MSDPGLPRGEIALIRRLQQRLAPAAAAPGAGAPGDVPFGDDMAGIPGVPDLLWTTDTLMDGVDFDSSAHTWVQMGRKAMAVNLSDCAAMGVQPVGALCSVVLQNDLRMEDAEALIGAAHEMGVRYNCPVVGGDTNSWDHPTVITVAVAARCQPGVPPVRRDGARAGDRIWVTGPCGGSILGRHLTFEPRVTLGLEIARDLRPHAMIDISDGLVLDLSRILEASGCGAVLEERLLDDCIHPDVLASATRQSPAQHALYDGEDFELIVVLPPDVAREGCVARGLLPIGHVTGTPGLCLEVATGGRHILEVRGWEHFR